MTGPALAVVGRHHQLVAGALPVVERAARKARWRCGARASYDDLCSIGKIVLYDTIPRFHDEPGRSLGRFARLRIWGAMMEELGRAGAQARMDHEMVLVADVERTSPDAERLLGDAQERTHAVEALRKALRDLAEHDLVLLDLLFTHELEPHKVGEILGVARETVYRRLQRLCARLRRRLREFGVTRAPSPTDLAGPPGFGRGRCDLALPAADAGTAVKGGRTCRRFKARSGGGTWRSNGGASSSSTTMSSGVTSSCACSCRSTTSVC
jgi:RNA polymerase sigma factor (sigma-70 family)